MQSSWSVEHYEAELTEVQSEVDAFRRAIGAKPEEPTEEALARYTQAVRLGCALTLERRAEEIAAAPPVSELVPKMREVTVAALIGGATLLRAEANSPGSPESSKDREIARQTDTRKDCTCLGTCKGAAELGEGWRCALSDGQALSGHVDKAQPCRPPCCTANDDRPYPERHPHEYLNSHGQNDDCEWHHLHGHTCGYTAEDHRYPCSPTCTHPDAVKPGHPERVKALSADIMRQLEQSKARGDVGGATTSPTSHAAGYVRLDDTATLFGARAEAPDHPSEIARREGFNEGAEAMRAACWEVVRMELEKMGALPDEVQRFASAIKTAKP